ncbi:MAG: carboxynorspermidine decarboxylase [Saprospiraceae bacterium]
MDYQVIPSPCYVLEEKKLKENLVLLQKIQREAGVSIILALKGFAMWSSFGMVKKYLAGATASSLNEALLCNEEMGKKAHTYSPVYLPSEFDEILALSSHISFNSIQQYELYREKVAAYNGNVSCGLRVNPEYSEIEVALYNPCTPGSRLGETIEAFGETLPEGIEGLHFHTHCESNSYSLAKTLEAFESRFGKYLKSLRWVNFGGGHLMTGEDYDVPHLIQLLKDFKARYDVEVVLEPGSAVAWNTGFLLATVLDIFESKGIKTAMVDISFTAHLPDTLEMPYLPRIIGATNPAVPGKPSYRIGGLSCLSGDYLEQYSFEQALTVGDRIIFEDMIHYTMVKTNMFNGVTHPNIGIWTEEESFRLVRQFSYEDYKNKLS